MNTSRGHTKFVSQVNSRMVNNAQIEELLRGQRDALRASGQAPGAATRRLVFPGAFNPLHEGHRQMAAIASQLANLPVEFELSVQNVDKPPLRLTDVQTRLAQFDANQLVWLTRAETFLKKAAIFSSATFVVGVDTIQRVADVGYYLGGRLERDKAIDQLRELACCFLVFGRTRAGVFRQLEDCQLPAKLTGICQGIPKSTFQLDVSSRALRRRGGEQ